MLWGRHVTLQIGQPGETGRSFSGLRISFRVKQTIDATPNSASIQAFNVSDQSVAELQRPGAVVRLIAGYDVPRLLFVGDPIPYGVRFERRGADRVLSIEAQDGSRRYRGAFVNVSIRRPTTLGEAFDAVAEQIGLPQGSIRGVDRARELPDGVTFTGNARDVMDRIARMSDADWTITDGAIDVIPRGGDTGERAVVFSVEQGNLIGSPKRTEQGVEVVGLLEPTMRPGRPFVVRSRELSGAFVAREVTHTGDSGYSPEFYTSIVGVPR